MRRNEPMMGCPMVANDWPTRTLHDGTVAAREPADPARCRGRYALPPVSSRPQRDDDDSTWPTHHDCPRDNPRGCPHWAERMERYGAEFGIPPRSRNATVEDLPDDIASDVMDYLHSVVSNVQGGMNIIIAGPVGAGKSCTAGLVLITYARLAGTDAVRFIDAGELFEFLRDAGRNLNFTNRDEHHGLIGADLLVIDDLGTELATSAALRNWHRLIDARYQAGRATIITTNSDDLDAVFHDERTRSRSMAKCVVWRTERGDMRGVAGAAPSPADQDGEDDHVEAAGDDVGAAACLPRPLTVTEWEVRFADIRCRHIGCASDLAFLLADHGIPAVATCKSETCALAEFEAVVRDVLHRAANSAKYVALLDAIAWRSHHHGFDYPGDFILRDWRERFADSPWSDRARERYGIPKPAEVGPGGAQDQE